MRVAMVVVLIAGCGEEFPDDLSSVDESDGYLAGAEKCGCNVFMDNTDFPAIQLDCDEDTEVYIDIPPVGVTTAIHAEGQVTDGPYTYYPDQGGIAVITMYPEYTDPRGAPFDERYHDVFVKSLVIPAQEACDPINAGHCIQFPRSTMHGVRAHCEEQLEDL